MISKPDITLLEKEFKFTTSRSGGPGGQHVNKVNTKVSLRWDVKHSELLEEDQREMIMRKLARVINKDGEVVLAADSHRSQLQNKAEVTNKLSNLLIKAFVKPKARKPTKPTKASIKRRLDSKKRLSEKKKLRRGID